jgi:membrane associated rhomboid family serine protease
VAITVAAFVLTYQSYGLTRGLASTIRPEAQILQLVPQAWRFWQFVTYAFLHGGYWHIIGNMFFLYLFGNNVNDRLGNGPYILFYLLGAVLSGVGHVVANPASSVPTVGASGAVAAVTGAYFVLFPRSLVTVLYFFFLFFGTVELPAWLFIGLKMILLDNVIIRMTPNVAYDAHLAGYGVGIIAALLLLRIGWLKRDGFDLWYMIEQWNKRRQYRTAVSEGFDPFAGTGRRSVDTRERPKTSEQQHREARIGKLRSDISHWLTQHNTATAAQLYIDLMKLDDSQILPRQSLLDVANQLASENRYTEAARAYEQMLTHYRGYEHLEQVKLMLGLIYARYLHREDRAREVLNEALTRLVDPNQKAMCRQELVRIGGGQQG